MIVEKEERMLYQHSFGPLQCHKHPYTLRSHYLTLVLVFLFSVLISHFYSIFTLLLLFFFSENILVSPSAFHIFIFKRYFGSAWLTENTISDTYTQMAYKCKKKEYVSYQRILAIESLVSRLCKFYYFTAAKGDRASVICKIITFFPFPTTVSRICCIIWNWNRNDCLGSHRNEGFNHYFRASFLSFCVLFFIILFPIQVSKNMILWIFRSIDTTQ